MKKSNDGYFLEFNVQYPDNLHEPHNDLPFLPEVREVDKVKKLAANLQDKYYTHKKSKISNSKKIQSH